MNPSTATIIFEIAMTVIALACILYLASKLEQAERTARAWKAVSEVLIHELAQARTEPRHANHAIDPVIDYCEERDRIIQFIRRMKSEQRRTTFDKAGSLP